MSANKKPSVTRKEDAGRTRRGFPSISATSPFSPPETVAETDRGSLKRDACSLVVYADGNAAVTEVTKPLRIFGGGSRSWIVYEGLPSSTSEEGMQLVLLKPEGDEREDSCRVVKVSFPRLSSVDRGEGKDGGMEDEADDEWRRWMLGKRVEIAFSPETNSQPEKREVRLGTMLALGNDLKKVLLLEKRVAEDESFPSEETIALYNRRISSVSVSGRTDKEEEGGRDLEVKSDRLVSVLRVNPSRDFVSRKRAVFEVRGKEEGCTASDVSLKLAYRISGLYPSVEYNVTLRRDKAKASMDVECYLCLQNPKRARFSDCSLRYVHGEIPTLRGRLVGSQTQFFDASNQDVVDDTYLQARSLRAEFAEASAPAPAPVEERASVNFVACDVEGRNDVEEDAERQKFRAFGDSGVPCELLHVCDTLWGNDSVFFVLAWTHKGGRVLVPGVYRVSSSDGEMLGDVLMPAIKPDQEYQLRLGKTHRVTAEKKRGKEWDDEKESDRTKELFSHAEYSLRVRNLSESESTTLRFVEHLASETQDIRVVPQGRGKKKPDAEDPSLPRFRHREKVPNTEDKDYRTHVFDVELKPGEKRTIRYVISTPSRDKN